MHFPVLLLCTVAWIPFCCYIQYSTQPCHKETLGILMLSKPQSCPTWRTGHHSCGAGQIPFNWVCALLDHQIYPTVLGFEMLHLSFPSEKHKKTFFFLSFESTLLEIIHEIYIVSLENGCFFAFDKLNRSSALTNKWMFTPASGVKEETVDKNRTFGGG